MSEAVAAPNTGAPSPAASTSTGDSGLFEGESQDNNGYESEGSEVSEIDAAVEAGDMTKAQAKDMKKKLKLKIDGKEEDFEIDLGNEDELKKHFQKSKSFDKRLQEFSGLRSNVDKFMAQLRESPESVLEQLGIDVDGMSEKRIQKKIEELSKSPEQVEREKMQAELEGLRKEKEESAKARETSEQESIMNKTAMEIESSIIKAMDKTNSILPKNNPGIIGEIAMAMKEAMVRGYNDVTVEDVVPIVEKRFRQRLSAMFDVLPEESLEAVVGKNNLERLRKKRLAKIPPPTSKNSGKDTGSAILEKNRADEKATNPKKTYSNFFKN